jgi:hypothetical protein
VAQLGANAHGEVLEPGRVPDCHLGLRLVPDDDDHVAGVLAVEPASLLHPGVPQPDGTVLDALVCAGHRPPRPDTPRAGVPGRPDGGAARLAP